MGNGGSRLLASLCVAEMTVNTVVLKALGQKSEDQVNGMWNRFVALNTSPGLALPQFAGVALMSESAAKPAFRVLSSAEQNSMVDAHEVRTRQSLVDIIAYHSDTMLLHTHAGHLRSISAVPSQHSAESQGAV